MNEQGKITEKELNEMEIYNLPNLEFKVIIIKRLTGHERRVNEQNNNFDIEIKNFKKSQSELKNTITKIKNTLEGINSRLENAVEWMTNLEDMLMPSTQAQQRKEEKGWVKEPLGQHRAY